MASEVCAAAVRVLARRQPAETARILLGYLPFADNNSVMDEVRTALAGLAYRDGKPEAALVAALSDPLALRRAVAVEALGELGIAQPRATIRRLLQDPNGIVRLRAAVTLANARESQAITSLIGLMTELPAVHGKEVEEYLISVAADQSPKTAFGDTEEARQKCRAAWAAWWNATERPGLLDEVRRRTYRPADNDQVLALVRQLGDDAFDVRQKAQATLREMGKSIIPALRHGVNDPDLEISTRARQLLLEIDKEAAAPLSAVVLRLVAFRKPPGAVEALLAYVAYADEHNIPDELQETLNTLAFSDGHAAPALLKGLSDPSPMVRAVAVEALCQPGAAEKLEVVRALLQDSDPHVRMRTALGLTAYGDRDAVGILIALLTELSPERAVIVEEYLQTLAGPQAPKLPANTGSDARQQRRESWAAWGKEQGSKTEIVAYSRHSDRSKYLGYTLMTLPPNGQIVELGTDGKPRWQMVGLMNPFDVEVLPGQRVLVAEYGGNRVTERNLKGDILWQRQAVHPVNCQRLPNGNTFIAMQHQLLEVDRAGKEIRTINRDMQDIMSARKMRDGSIAMVTQSSCIRLDSSGKELKSFALPNGAGTYFVDITPKGTFVLPQAWNNKVCEYDADGKVIAEISANQPMAACRVPNGNTLFASQAWPPKVVEVDRSGKTIWEHQPATQPGRLKRR
jgi:HEAT repeat protein